MKSPDIGSSKKTWFFAALFIAAIAVLFFATTADAEGPVVDQTLNPTRTLTCTKPLAREGGMALQPGDIARIDFYRGPSKTGPWQSVGSDTECRFADDISALSPGQYYYMARAVDADGRQSAPSNVLPLDVRRIQPPAAITDLGWQ